MFPFFFPPPVLLPAPPSSSPGCPLSLHSLSYLSLWMWAGPGRLLRASGRIHLHSGLPGAVRDALLQLPGLHRGGGGVGPWQDLPSPLLRLLLLQVRDRMQEMAFRKVSCPDALDIPPSSESHKTTNIDNRTGWSSSIGQKKALHFARSLVKTSNTKMLK